jgi:hypothetical protein
MCTVPAGYTLALVTDEGTIAGTLDISGYNLISPVERAHVAGGVASLVHRATEATRAGQEASGD